MEIFDFFVLTQNLRQYKQEKSAPICEICGKLFSKMVKTLFFENAKLVLGVLVALKTEIINLT